MATITTRLVKDGNSMAVRLPKHLLLISGLHGVVQLDVAKGQITVRAIREPRAGWKEQIEREIVAHGPLTMADDYGDLLVEADATLADGLDA
jgi:antitoxin component of MazEF toxin-antitoxin module